MLDIEASHSALPPSAERAPEEERAPSRELLQMRLWAMDAWTAPGTILTESGRLRSIMHDAARDGGVTVLGEEFCVFDNGAVTGVLVLAQSHLSIHTWPEFSLANVDLLSYGQLQGRRVMEQIARGLNASRVNIRCMVRAQR